MRNLAQGSRAINQAANKFSALLKNKVAGELPEQKDDIDLARQQVFELFAPQQRRLPVKQASAIVTMSKHHEAKLAEGAMDNATLKMALDAAFAGVL